MSQNPTKGWKGKLRIATTEGGLTSDEDDIINVSTNIGNDVEEAYHLGSRSPQELMEGNISIGLSLSKFLVDLTWSGYAGVGATGALTEY